jgi:4-amino-4-deoxy-L-arabinose transferase-like glycosyltransferase
VSGRARRIEHPAPGSVRVRPRARRARARSAAYHPSAARAGLRITRRGRIALLVLAAIAVYAAFGLGRASADAAHSPAHGTTAVVHSGDSLWTIAVREFPNSDPRDVVGQLKSLNHLSSSDLAVGQKLRLP